jgi:hypothetical protein
MLNWQDPKKVVVQLVRAIMLIPIAYAMAKKMSKETT